MLSDAAQQRAARARAPPPALVRAERARPQLMHCMLLACVDGAPAATTGTQQCTHGSDRQTSARVGTCVYAYTLV